MEKLEIEKEQALVFYLICTINLLLCYLSVYFYRFINSMIKTSIFKHAVDLSAIKNLIT